VLIFVYISVITIRNSKIFHPSFTENVGQGIFILVIGVIIGLLLSALQTQLYRILEGYLGLPAPIVRWATYRQSARKAVLDGRVDRLDLMSALESRGRLSAEGQRRLDEINSDVRIKKYADRDDRLTELQAALLTEKRKRYPVESRQVAPTRLGNAIRRLEEYGSNRFNLDSQTMWYELYIQSPEEARNQVNQSRTTVDFFVCLLFGHLLVAVALTFELLALDLRRPTILVFVIVVLALLAMVWYRAAIAATDTWAAAVRALVNVGRKPLAEGLGFQLPATLSEEREMWDGVGRTVDQPYHPAARATDKYRSTIASDSSTASDSQRE
jgi:hypothetical protein